MSDEIEFEGGFFDEAGIDVSQIADDPYGFGNDYWPVYVVEVGPVKLTANKDKLGMMVKFAVDHERFAHSPVAEKLGNGHWYQVPVPKALRNQIPWDENGQAEQLAMFKLKQLLKALGFPADQMSKANGKTMIGRHMLTKIKPVLDEMGFWKFNLNSPKPMAEGSSNGLSEFTQNGQSNANSGKTATQLAEEELKKELGE